jgi:hypothetical protein
MAGLAILTAAIGAAVAFMQFAVPLPAPTLARARVADYWQVAVIAALSVLIVSGAIAWLVLSRRSE